MNFLDGYFNAGEKIRSKSARQEYYCALIEYYYKGEEPSFKYETASVAFEAFRYSLNKSRKQSENASKPRIKSKPNDSQTLAKRQPNASGTLTKEEEEEKDKSNDLSNPIVPYAEIVWYLNEKADTAYKPTSVKTKTLIAARFKEGYTLDDFKSVIDKKCASWKTDAKMACYLRPETLFGTKFESYLNELSPGKQGGENFAKYD